MLVVENQHDTKDCPYELLFYPLKMLLTGGAVEFSIRGEHINNKKAFDQVMLALETLDNNLGDDCDGKK